VISLLVGNNHCICSAMSEKYGADYDILPGPLVLHLCEVIDLNEHGATRIRIHVPDVGRERVLASQQASKPSGDAK